MGLLQILADIASPQNNRHDKTPRVRARDCMRGNPAELVEGVGFGDALGIADGTNPNKKIYILLARGRVRDTTPPSTSPSNLPRNFTQESNRYGYETDA